MSGWAPPPGGCVPSLYKPRMDVGFGTALLFAGGLLAIAAALSGLMRGTVLSISVLSVAAGLILAEAGTIHVDATDSAVVHLFLLALIVTLLLGRPLRRARAARRSLGPGGAGAGDRDAADARAARGRRQAALLRAELGGGVPARRRPLGDRPGGDLGGGDLAAGARGGSARAQSRVGPQRRASPCRSSSSSSSSPRRAATPGPRRRSCSGRPPSER